MITILDIWREDRSLYKAAKLHIRYHANPISGWYADRMCNNIVAQRIEENMVLLNWDYQRAYDATWDAFWDIVTLLEKPNV